MQKTRDVSLKNRVRKSRLFLVLVKFYAKWGLLHIISGQNFLNCLFILNFVRGGALPIN